MSRFSLAGACMALALIASGAHAQDAPPEAAVALTLDEAVAMALARQPQLQALAAALRAQEAGATADAQLPDPQLTAAVIDLPLAGAERYSLRRDSDTQLSLGLMQSFPRGRNQRGERGARESDLRRAELERRRREIGRDAALAWLEAWQAERARELVRAAAAQAQLQLEATDIAWRNNRATQADVLSARLALSGLQDEAAKREQDAQHARSMLSRWIGDEAARLLCPDLPEWSAPPPLADLQQQLQQHPHLLASRAAVGVAQADVELARQDYRPGWSVELDYGYRAEFADMGSLKFSFDLPVFTRRRQDQRLLAAQERLQQSESLAEDDLKDHRAELRLNYTDWQLLQQRLRRYDDSILPDASRRIEAARLAWQSGAGTLTQVLDARRAEVGLRLQRLELQTDQAEHSVQLAYLSGAQHE